LNGKMQRRRSSLVALSRIGTGVYQRAYGGQGSCSDGPVQRRDAGAVRRIGIRSNRCEVLDCFSLGGWIPMIGVRRVVQWLRSSAIFRSAVGPVRNEQFGYGAPECRGSHVESGVAAIEVMTDVGEEKGGGALSHRADLGRCRSQSRNPGHPAGHLLNRPACNESNEIKER
jgi:hypothetical protein